MKLLRPDIIVFVAIIIIWLSCFIIEYLTWIADVNGAQKIKKYLK
jgi:hypothetical protein